MNKLTEFKIADAQYRITPFSWKDFFDARNVAYKISEQGLTSELISDLVKFSNISRIVNISGNMASLPIKDDDLDMLFKIHPDNVDDLVNHILQYIRDVFNPTENPDQKKMELPVNT